MWTIHLIEVADLNDPSIGATCAIDLKAVREFIEEAASQAGMALQITEVIDSNFDAEHITSAVRDLAPSWDDTVVFYYSGHGMRGESKPDAWPLLNLPYSGGRFDTFDLAWIYRTLNGKRPRMLLMFVDCCQVKKEDALVVDHSPAIRGLVDIYSATNFRLLFQSFQGEVLLISCKPGQTSGCGAVGGFFTHVFLGALRSSVEAVRDPTWEEIAKLITWGEIAELCPKTSKQEPMWKVVHPVQLTAAQAPGMEPLPGDWRSGQVSVTSEPILAAASPRQTGKRFCGSCGTPLDPGDRFCPQCGTQSAVTDGAPGAPVHSTISGERRASDAPLSRLDTLLQQSEERIARTREQTESRLARLKDLLKDR